MFDIAIESIRLILVLIILTYLVLQRKKGGMSEDSGWCYIIYGFSFIVFGMFMDILDNFTFLNKYLLIGDTVYQAIIEKIVGYLLGFLLLTIGFIKWLPRIVAIKQLKGELEYINANLEKEVDKRTNELKLQKEEAENATRLKDKFVLLVAHDLREPFNASLGYLDLLGKDKNNPLNQRQQEILGKVQYIGNNQLKLIDEILNIGRIKSGALVLKPDFFNARILVFDVLEKILVIAEKKQIVIENKIKENIEIYVDYDFFAEVILNLVNNAIKFSYEQETVLISVECKAEWIIIGVHDHGQGISKQNLTKLFKVEEKVSTKGTAGERGTGFGLPFSQDIMLAHNGEITVSSEEGVGSNFYVHLPNVIKTL